MGTITGTPIKVHNCWGSGQTLFQQMLDLALLDDSHITGNAEAVVVRTEDGKEFVVCTATFGMAGRRVPCVYSSNRYHQAKGVTSLPTPRSSSAINGCHLPPRSASTLLRVETDRSGVLIM
jgi:hypothetical protein